uniref:J domain-containing protein n=1 Tax=Coccolithus braarudii TaxID=221442 RepID=A0A7S0PZT3_9EUKA
MARRCSCKLVAPAGVRPGVMLLNRSLLHLRQLCASAEGGPPSHPDYFALLNVERRFDLDEVELQRAYRQLMAQLHPDRHSRAGELEQREVADRSAAVTHAHATLKAAHSRATHLLELRGVPLDEDSSGGLLAPSFLMEVMETREALETASPDAELPVLREVNDAATAEVCAGLAAAFDEGRLEEARRLTAQLQYLRRIGHEITERSEAV